MKSYPDIIRGLREDKDLKQAEIAEIIGTTQQQYSKYENGQAELPVKALVILADYYQVSTDYLLGKVAYTPSLAELERHIKLDSKIGAALSQMIDLTPDGRNAVMEYAKLQHFKETMEQS